MDEGCPHGAFPIAIDGPAASGKTTLGRLLAAELDCAFLDTGIMYRAFTLAAMRVGVPASDEAACASLVETLDLRLEGQPEARAWLGTEDVTDRLREPQVEANVSDYSKVAAVRTRLVGAQRAFAASRRAILAGRDIGTVVLPRAPLKLYLEASPEARARRRSGQASEWGARRDEAGAAADIGGRDAIDAARKQSPLRPATDAVVFDTTEMTIDDLYTAVMGLVRTRNAAEHRE